MNLMILVGLKKYLELKNTVKDIGILKLLLVMMFMGQKSVMMNILIILEYHQMKLMKYGIYLMGILII